MKHSTFPPGNAHPVGAPQDVVLRFLPKAPREAAALSSAEGLGLTLLDCNPDPIHLIDANGEVLWINRAAGARCGGGTPGIRGFDDLAHYWPAVGHGERAVAIADAAAGRNARITTATSDAEGERWWELHITAIPATTATSGHFLLVAHEVTAQHHAVLAAEHAASHDHATGLPGGRLFRHFVQGLVAAGDHDFFVLVADLDDTRDRVFKLGREEDEAIFLSVAGRLKRALRKGEMAARLGGKRFGIVLRDRVGAGPDDGRKRAQYLVDRLKRPVQGKAQAMSLVHSFALARCPTGEKAAEKLYSNAIYALQAAKALDAGQLVEFDPSLERVRRRTEYMLTNAECALESHSIFPYYQPKVDLLTGRVCGLEALLRWRSPSGSIETPSGIWSAFFEPLLSRRITQAMLGKVLNDIQRWRRRGLDVPVALNIADADLRQPDFAAQLIRKLAAAGLPPACLEIEVTETIAVGRDSEHIAAMLNELHAAGIRIALDDFGTGYASLVNLKQLPVDILKIDRRFVSQFESDAGDCAIVEAILGMARQLGIKVVAEGIETEQQALLLRDRGCQIGQGYLFGKAAPAHMIPKLLAAPVHACLATN